MLKKKNLSNPFSTGGGGTHFETHVQASFVALMLTGGYAPCLPCWPIVEIKFQGMIDGYNTDDLIVFVENADNRERRKLLGQIKHYIEITNGSSLFGEVMQAAWNDFNNPDVFKQGKDCIALITGPLNTTDEHNVQWLLKQARYTKNVDEFLRNVEQANFSPSKCNEKLQVIKYHLKIANDDKDISKDELYNFLKHFHLLGYDLGNETGVVLSLLYSHISQFQLQYPQQVWSRIVDIVQSWNHNAGCLVLDKLPEDLLKAFKSKVVIEMPKELMSVQEISEINWAQHPDAIFIALAVLVGAWNEKSESDIDVITQLYGIDYESWLKKARELIQLPDSPLSVKNGIWKVVNRDELWNQLGSCIFDQNLEKFKSLVVTVLSEKDPAFELPSEDRYYASINGNVLKCSKELRNGIVEGLAILGSQPSACINCTQGKIETICVLVTREILTDAEWVLWGSLDDVLPTFAEAAPGEFLVDVEKALYMTQCPFEELFAQETNGIFGRNYLNGLLWALEGLAWDEQYLVRVCVVLGELANQDVGGQWANRPLESLTNILLPWKPHTLASFNKRKVAIQTLLLECEDIAWNLIIRLLPGQYQTSFGTHKPNWRKINHDDWDKGVSNKEYWQQMYYYTELAVTTAGNNISRLSELIDHFNNLPNSAFYQLIEVLASEDIIELPESQRLLLWDHLTKFTSKHRKFLDAEWALSEELITIVENVTAKIAPTNPFNLYQPLFADSDFDLYEEKGNWEVQRMKLITRQENAIIEIFQQSGINGVIRFAEVVISPEKVGRALGVINDKVIEQALLPHFLDTTEMKYKSLVSGFIWKRYQVDGWSWCDNIDKSGWIHGQIGQFLACLPFIKEAWVRANEWLDENQSEYWSRTEANVYQADEDLDVAIEMLIKHNRPNAAINCLDMMLHNEQTINIDQCVRSLLNALNSSASTNVIDQYQIVELIKFLQAETSVSQDDLLKIEWAYLPLLDGYNGTTPKLLESRLANNPEFFCEVIRLIYRSNKEDNTIKETSDESKTIATNAWRLLYKWKTPPGINEDETFSEDLFHHWLQRVRSLCMESGHLEVAMIKIGEVLIHAPSDPDGLWIHRSVAAALNDRDAKDMRHGFSLGIFNSRGVHWIDPTGKPEKEQAIKFRYKAEVVENIGFQRFAVTLRELAESYEREAQNNINEHKSRGDDCN